MLRSPFRAAAGLACLLALAGTASNRPPHPQARPPQIHRWARQLRATDGIPGQLLQSFATAFPRLSRPLHPHLATAEQSRLAAAEALATNPPAACELAGELVVALRLARRTETVDALTRVLLGLGPLALDRVLPAVSDREPAVRLRALSLIADVLTRSTFPTNPVAPTAGRTSSRPPFGADGAAPSLEGSWAANSMPGQRSLPSNPTSDLATVLSSSLETAPDDVRLALTRTLALLGPHAEVALPLLLRQEHSPVAAVRAATAECLGRIEGRPLDSVPTLQRLTADPAPEVRQSAAVALGRFNGSAHSAVPTLAKAAQDSEAPVALAAVNALGRIGPTETDSTPTLVQCLGHPNPTLRAAAATALGRIGGNRPAAVTALAGSLCDQDEYVRHQAVVALAAFGPRAAPAVTALIDRLRDPLESVRALAAQTLGAIGPKAAAAIPHLRAARDNNPSAMNRPVVEALIRIEKADPGLLASER